MATSTLSYRQSTRQTSSAAAGDDSAALRSKLEQARRQRTAFYRRLAETGARAQSDDGGGGGATEVDIDVDAETMARRQRERLNASSPYLDVVSSVSSTNASLLEQPEPRSSWRYYTSYDNGGGAGTRHRYTKRMPSWTEVSAASWRSGVQPA